MQTLKIQTVKCKSFQIIVCRISRAKQTEQQCSESADAIFGFLVMDFHSEPLYCTQHRSMFCNTRDTHVMLVV